MAVKAIISDLGNVLIDVDKENMCAKFARYSPLSVEKIRGYFDPAVLKGIEIDFGCGKISRQNFYEAIYRELKLEGLPYPEFDRIYSIRFTRKEDSIALMRKLARNYPLALLSNTNEIHYPYWLKILGQDIKLFNHLVLSFEVGLAKPNPQIYLEAAKRLGVASQACVFIDDVGKYAEASALVGMRGIQFTSAAQLETDLKNMGVSV